LVEKLNYLTIIRPYFSFAFGVVSQFLNSPCQKLMDVVIRRGVMVQFGAIFIKKMSEPMKSSSVRFGFYYFSKKKSNITSWFESVRLINLLENTI